MAQSLSGSGGEQRPEINLLVSRPLSPTYMLHLIGRSLEGLGIVESLRLRTGSITYEVIRVREGVVLNQTPSRFPVKEKSLVNLVISVRVKPNLSGKILYASLRGPSAYFLRG